MRQWFFSEKYNITIKVFVVVACLTAGSALSTATTVDIFLDADTPETGSLLETQPLVTSYGTISFVGTMSTLLDAEFNAAGASGNKFDIPARNQNAQLSFDFDIFSVEFIYGGNYGSITVEARNAADEIVGSFYDPNTNNINQPAGPITISAVGIRSIRWYDTPEYGSCALDNISITVPEPCTIMLLAMGSVALVKRRTN